MDKAELVVRMTGWRTPFARPTSSPGHSRVWRPSRTRGSLRSRSNMVGRYWAFSARRPPRSLSPDLALERAFDQECMQASIIVLGRCLYELGIMSGPRIFVTGVVDDDEYERVVRQYRIIRPGGPSERGLWTLEILRLVLWRHGPRGGRPGSGCTTDAHAGVRRRMGVPGVGRLERDRLRRQVERIEREPIDSWMGLEHADRVGRQDDVELARKPRALNERLEPRRRCGPESARPQRPQDLGKPPETARGRDRAPSAARVSPPLRGRGFRARSRALRR